MTGQGTGSQPLSGRITQAERVDGAVSGITNGSVSKTNIDVFADAPWANLTGMCSATYSCQRGDSGAAILLIGGLQIYLRYAPLP